jgi:hypothetical protein
MMEIENIKSVPGYEIKKYLGEGGAGYVVKVSKDSQEYACKILHPEVAKDPKFESIRDGFILEAERMESNKHRCLVKVLDKGNLIYKYRDSEMELPYFIMELVEGKPLNKWIKQEGTNEEKLFSLWSKISRELLEVLNFLHTNPDTPLMHLDIKSQNVMVHGALSNPKLKLMDFGVAQNINDPNFTSRGEHVQLTTSFEILPLEWKKLIISMKDQNSTFVLIPRDQADPTIDLHMMQAMLNIISDDEGLTMDYLSGNSLNRAKYLKYWLERMNWDITPKEFRFSSANEAIDNCKRIYGWPVRPSILFGSGILRLPMENLRYFGKCVRNIVNHKEFQRLRNIKQLGMGHYVYPGGTHTRCMELLLNI